MQTDILENMSASDLDDWTTFNLGLELKEEIKKSGRDPTSLSEPPGLGIELPLWARSNDLSERVVGFTEAIQDTERTYFTYHELLLINKKIIEIAQALPN